MKPVKSGLKGLTPWPAFPRPATRRAAGPVPAHGQAQHRAALGGAARADSRTSRRRAASRYLWKYKDVRPYIMEAGKLITAKEAIRRVLVLENPGMRGESCITQSLYAGPAAHPAGRDRAQPSPHASRRCASSSRARAPTPRSTASAPPCVPGDFIITPSWTWHDHGNPGNEPVVWMDGLDIRIVRAVRGAVPRGVSRGSRSR